jgi:hypothetical protein
MFEEGAGNDFFWLVDMHHTNRQFLLHMEVLLVKQKTLSRILFFFHIVFSASIIVVVVVIIIIIIIIYFILECALQVIQRGFTFLGM